MRLIVYESLPPILQALLKTWRCQAVARRLDVHARIERMEVIYGAVIAAHPDLVHKIKDMKRRLQLQTRGMPATESIDAPDARGFNAWDTMPDAVVTNKFLCKKAYRVAIKHAHPDLGGSDTDFALLNAAYRSHDLGTLQEYVLSLTRTPWEQLAHWQTELQKPAVAWVRYQASEEFRVVKYQMSGRPELAQAHAQELLRRLHTSLEIDLLKYTPPVSQFNSPHSLEGTS